MWVQQKLRSQGFDPGPADGVFGPKTRTALIMFQAKYDLNQDGVIGPATWKQLQHISQHQTSNTQPQSANIKDGIQSIPAFSPAVVPSIDFNIMEPGSVVEDDSPPIYLVWLALISLITISGTVYASRQEIDKEDSGPSEIYYPKPVYPSLKPVSATAPPQPANPARGPLDQIPDEIKHLSSSSPWAKPQAAGYLENFVFDILDPVSRHQLASQICHQQVQAGRDVHKLLLRIMAFLPVPLHQIGVFPEIDERSGQPYKYSLMDDLGGAFMMLRNELWMTRVAHPWLQEDTPYVLTIRREDAFGEHLDKQYVIAIDDPNTKNKAQASLAA